MMIRRLLEPPTAAGSNGVGTNWATVVVDAHAALANKIAMDDFNWLPLI
jgi:hypothetical protein